MPRNSITTFMELLTRARVIEEHQNETKTRFKYCDFCKMRNHSTLECNKKRQEVSKLEPTNIEEDNGKNVIKCYGCGKPGFIRTNCPDCNQTVHAASIELDFSHVMLTFEAPIPTISCEINGFSESAFFDTAAKTSIASETLHKQLLKKECKTISKEATIKQADGKIRIKTVLYLESIFWSRQE
ncbi:hypothetical protein Bhyg_07649 [Pseudolycoriella hygida]|uniref:CCHC-type domain-containing protein n=1 Tax=Pseudolycoriella hygida TaxID=35572 RepID=A0A9Q0N363_9DIPT|nr:hypothetical protein Bhyg_07649 [Pseudolycoriella hygida]